MNPEPHLQLPKIRDWAEQHGPNQTLGLAQSGCECPIHSYLKRIHSDCQFMIDKRTVRYWPSGRFGEENGSLRLPANIVQLIAAFDRRGAYQPITAGTALQIIQRIQA